jgi:hypothetical protein
MYATADFDGDGLQDIALVDFLTDSVNVLIAEPIGTFRAAAKLAAPRGPHAVVAADFNEDHKPDLAVGEFLSGTVRVFPGRGDGLFGAPRVVRVGEGISSIVALDLNRDGRTDIAGANALSGAVLVLINSGVGSLNEAAEIGRTDAATVLTTDVNGDGIADLAALDAQGRQANVFAGKGDGLFADATAMNAEELLSIASADASRNATRDRVSRLDKVDGDGVASHVGTSTSQVVVEVKDATGDAPVGDGQIVVFSRVGGGLEEVRATDAHGRASLAVTFPGLPDVSVIAAALPADQAAHFALVSILTDRELATRLEAALELANVDDIEMTERIGLLRQASDSLSLGHTIAAIRSLRLLLDQLSPPQTGGSISDAVRSAADLSRRFINQILLAGVIPAVPDDEPISCDVPLTRTIATLGEVDKFTFACVAGEVVHVSLGNHGGSFGFNPQWRLLGPDGNPDATCGTLTATDRDCAVTPAGNYAIEVRDVGSDATGTYSVHVQRLTDTQRCGGSLTCDTTLTTTIDTFADTDLHSFTGVAAEIVHLTLGNHGGSFGFNPQWRLIAPDGTPAAGCGTFAATDRECTLPAAGNYAVEVIDAEFNASGTYSVHLQRLTAGQRCTGSLTCDAALVTTIDAFADSDLHSFTGMASEIVHVTLGNHGGSFGFNPQWRLLASNGSPAAVCGTFAAAERDCTLPVVGSYAVEVIDADFNASGTYSVHLQRLTAAQRCGGSLTCGVPVTTTISAFADTDLHSFTGVSGQNVHVSLANLGGSFGFNPQWRLLRTDGAPASVCGTYSGPGEFDCSLPAAGAYAVEVTDDAFNASGTYRLTVSGAGCTNAQPNLRVTVLDGKGVAGAGLSYKATDTTKNVGAAAASASATTFYISNDKVLDPGDTLLVPTAGRSVPLLAPDASSKGSTMVTIPVGTTTGKWFLIAKADGGAVVAESNENDNTKANSIFVGPDLRVVALNAAANASPGETISVSDTTKNVGGATTTVATTTRLYLSINKKWDPSDVPLGPGRSVPILAAGATNMQSTNVVIPNDTTLGSFFILARADDAGVQVESRETNNVKATAITIK